MKIWKSHAGEHSAKLRIVGRFRTAEEAAKAEELFEELSKLAQEERLTSTEEYHNDPDAKRIIKEYNMYSIGFSDLEGLNLPHTLTRNGKEVEVTTDDEEIQGLLKIMIHYGARVEMYSKHDYP